MSFATWFCHAWTTAMHFCTVPNQKTWTIYSLFKKKAVKLIFSAGKRDSPSLLMNTLHWLPIWLRIIFLKDLYVSFQMSPGKCTRIPYRLSFPQTHVLLNHSRDLQLIPLFSLLMLVKIVLGINHFMFLHPHCGIASQEISGRHVHYPVSKRF